MALLVPAILAKTAKEFNEKLEMVAPYCHKIQVDIMDGIFVKEKTISVNEIPKFTYPLKIELHLMIKDPLSIFQYEKHPAVSAVIFHYESTDKPAEILQAMPKRIIKGVALNPETPTKVLQPIISQIDMVLLMSVKPGKDGQQFMPNTLVKISEVKNMRPGIIVEVDGGINSENAADIANLGVDQAVVGSTLYGSNNLKRTIKNIMLELGDIEGVAV
ncbi:MAG: ribulose-phosphate 3-epimerase [bacterium]|nr:ribulose-phosphate 3-epimerase [bacterium]